MSGRVAISSVMATDSNYQAHQPQQLSPNISLMSHLQRNPSKPETRRSRVVASKSIKDECEKNVIRYSFIKQTDKVKIQELGLHEKRHLVGL